MIGAGARWYGEPPRFPSSTEPTVPGIYDALLGGKDNYEADRDVAERNLEITPDAMIRVLAQRLFLERVVEWMVREAGIRQLLDIGCGKPKPRRALNVHEIAQHIAPDTKVVYVDRDLIAVSHMDALQTGGNRAVACRGDLRDPALLDHPEIRGTLDLTQPVGVILIGVLHFVTDVEKPAEIVARLRKGLAPGSYLAVSQISAELDSRVEEVAALHNDAGITMVSRGRDELAEILTGFQDAPPEIVPVHEWNQSEPTHIEGNAYGAVVRKGHDS